MSNICEVIDCYSPIESTFERLLLLSKTTPSRYRILRILIGEVIITHKTTIVSFTQDVDFVGKSYISDADATIQERLAGYIGEDITLSDLKKNFIDIPFSYQNRDFYLRLENEIVNFLYYQNKGSYTTAFVFIYRILELISFSFPLIYASKTTDFKHTYNSLKEFYDGNKGAIGGELGFLKSAVQVIFKENDLMTTSIDINLDYESEDLQINIYSALYAIIKPALIHENTLENRKLSIKFGEVSSFIITLRNRFFHLFNRGDKNLESSDVIDSDMLFSKINQPMFEWLSVLYLETIKISFIN